jgi:hypothetical protein
MAITTIDGAIAGMQYPRFFTKGLSSTMVAGRPFSYWHVAGVPGSGVFSGTLNGVALSGAITGAIPFPEPAGNNTYLARFQGQSTIAGTLLLCDRIWHNGGYTITSTGSQSITSPTWPQRDANGVALGEGLLCAVEVVGTTGAGTPTITIGYTNSAGTASRTATNINATVASSVGGTFYMIGLQTGDTGIRSIQSLTLSVSWTSGIISLVVYRVLATLEIAAALTSNAVDSLTSGFPRCYDGTVPFLVFIPSTTTTSNVMGQVVWTQG